MIEWNVVKTIIDVAIPASAAVSWAYKKIFAWRCTKQPVITYENDDFARETIKYRFNDIISKLNAELACGKPVISYKDFQEEVLNKIQFVDKDVLKTQSNSANAKLMDEWMRGFNSYKNVAEILQKCPFIDVEYFFYFWVLTKIDQLCTKKQKQILHPGYKVAAQFDPYKFSKLRMLEKDFMNDEEEQPRSGYCSKIKECLDYVIKINNNTHDGERKEQITDILKANLSSNSSDLSQMFWSDFRDVEFASDQVNHSEKFWKDYCRDVSNKTINIVVDNFGIEFLWDLVLGYYLTTKGVTKIIYHVKHIPMFVSDVVEGDHTIMFDKLESLLNISKSRRKKEYLSALNLLKASSEKFVFKANYLWNMPYSFSKIVSTNSETSSLLYNDIIDLFTGNELLIVKGDLNYRRLVEDKLWNSRRKTVQKIKYAKCPILVIRSYKSSVVMDSNIPDSKMVQRFGPDWKTDGRVGAVLYYNSINRWFKTKR